jgi:hypothetical protein
VSTHRHPNEGADASFSGRLGAGRLLVTILIPVLMLASITFVRASGITSPSRTVLAAAVGSLTPREIREAAADALEKAVATGGAGYTFEIVQHATIAAKPGGPLIEIPDPLDRHKSLGEAATYALGTYLERGVVTPAGFHSEIRRGPDDPRATAAWDGAPTELAALVRADVTYRNDGQGWYKTTRPPGIGLDPATAALLPTLLRQLADVTDTTDKAPAPAASLEPGRALADPFADLAPARRLDGKTKVADIPGIIAVDLAGATELRGPAELAFDADGRLIGMRVLARNTHLDNHDLLIETVITFGYPATAPDLPKAEPTWVAPPAPAEGE